MRVFPAVLMSIAVGASLWAAGAAHAAPGPVTVDPAKVPAGTYVLDKTHASLTAKIVHMGFSRYTLRFTKLDASFAYDPAALATTKLAVTIDPTSIDTGSEPFNKELQGPAWLNVAAHPTITFNSTAVTAGVDGKGTVVGDLNFLGVTKPVTLDVVFNGYGPGFPVGSRAGFSATAHIKRTDFGLKTYVPLVGDDVELLIEVEFAKK